MQRRAVVWHLLQRAAGTCKPLSTLCLLSVYLLCLLSIRSLFTFVLAGLLVYCVPLQTLLLWVRFSYWLNEHPLLRFNLWLHS